jgi:hypothetical protein
MPTATATVPTKLTGDRFLIWNPERDLAARGGVGDSRPIRSYHFSWESGFSGESIGGKIPVFKTINFRVVGRNLVNCELWEEAKAASEKMPGNPLQARIKSGAITEVPPAKTEGELTGTMADYKADEQMLLIDHVFDADILRLELETLRDSPKVASYARDRIKALETGEIK